MNSYSVVQDRFSKDAGAVQRAPRGMILLLYIWRVMFVTIGLCTVSFAQGASTSSVGDFSSGHLLGWETKSYADETRYELVEQDGRHVLRAYCQDSSSTLIKYRKVDLQSTPILKWSWSIDHVYTGLEEKTRKGDDFPARVTVILDGGLFIWRTRAINYVWSSSQPEDTVWRSPFFSQSLMVAVRSGAPNKHRQWFTESRDVRKDFKDLFNKDVDAIDAVAITTDCDNSHQEGIAFYGDINFSED